MINIIRTPAVELTAIPAIAYKQKLSAGGAGVKIFRLDTGAVTVMTIDRRTGEGVPHGKLDDHLFPEEAISEAISLTNGIACSALGKIKVSVLTEVKEPDDVDETEAEKIDLEAFKISGTFRSGAGLPQPLPALQILSDPAAHPVSHSPDPPSSPRQVRQKPS